MGEFNWDIINPIIAEKLANGLPLSPEERAVYDLLMGLANQGVNIYNSPDMASLRTDMMRPLAIQALDNYFNMVGTARAPSMMATLNSLAGSGVFPQSLIDALAPEYTNPQFTRVGSIEEEFARRGGIRGNEGAYMAAGTQADYNLLKALLSATSESNVNAYSLGLNTRGQNIDAAARAGQLASAGQDRVARLATAAPRPGGGGGGGGGGEMPRPPLQLPLPPTPEAPSIWDRLAGPLATGAFGLGGIALREYLSDRKKGDQNEIEERTPPSNMLGDEDDPRTPYPLLDPGMQGFGFEPGVSSAYNIYREGERNPEVYMPPVNTFETPQLNSTMSWDDAYAGQSQAQPYDWGFDQYTTPMSNQWSNYPVEPQPNYDDYYAGFNQVPEVDPWAGWWDDYDYYAGDAYYNDPYVGGGGDYYYDYTSENF